MERYSLRMLLIRIKGAESFDELRTDPEGNLCSTFQEAAMRRGYLDDDNEWHNCLQEAAETAMPYKLCALFATILINCKPKDPLDLWNRNHTNFYHHMPNSDITEEELIYRVYHRIETIVQKHNSSHTLAHDYHIPVPPGNFPEHVLDGIDEVERQLHAQLGAEMYSTLNDTQRAAFNAIHDSVHNHLGKQFFIDGPGGTGKSYIYKALISTLLGENKKVIRVASTGIAATLIGGVTAHKRFGIPIKLDHDTVSMITNQSKEADHLRECDLIIWDEATASHRHALELVDRLLQDVMGNDLPFGGKTVVLGGDFRQCLPVVPRASASAQIAASIRTSPLWDHFAPNTFQLTHNHRSQQADFSEWLLTVGNGTSGIDTFLNPDLIDIVHTPKALIHNVFGSAINGDTLPQMRKHVILSPTNKNTDALNEAILQLMEGPNHYAESIDSPIRDEESNMILPEEFLHTLTPPGMPPHKLNLKVGGVYMLLRNMDVEAGCCNGTRFFILEIQQHYIHCEIIPNDTLLEGQQAYQFLLPRVKLTPPASYPFTFTRKQYPIKPAFAMTINKSQGGTFDVVGLDLSSHVFSHGQLYVALSRVKNWQSIHIFMQAPPQARLADLPTTRNIVWSQIFDHSVRHQQNRQLTQRPPLNLPPNHDNEEASTIHRPPQQSNPAPYSNSATQPHSASEPMPIQNQSFDDSYDIGTIRDEDDDQTDEYRASLEAFFGLPDHF
jgi:ATP-dependent DNA helicase PIF1